ncbi:hypothetical protein GCM10017044_10370 [Kordiimonas sediminis]|uniref:Uncharacterized protein n=1 Tax=Kordiimonas sediminis TaxID=1735581 RepID=A0A919E664_9PROT|nr:hypothetical protein [Kordiimonas sediminis]GHF17843.1 hypothetical protein GCM10017044_10370 [Kordiimonas sediminis]
MFGTLFTALMMGVLVGGLSYALFWWAHRVGLTDDDGTVKKRPKRNEETGKKQDRKTGDYTIDKWLSFGGGYYGVVALLTFILIELEQAIEFLTDWDAIVRYFSTFGINTLVQFLINQIQNFVQAIIWPVEYIQEYQPLEWAILFAVTYGAFRIAQAYAKQKNHQTG